MSTVAIKVGGVDITPLVIFEDARFTTLVSGLPGSFRFRVRDLDRVESYVVGAEVTVDIDGTRNFTGFLLSVARQFFFPADRADGMVARALVLEGVDINILFRKRIIHSLVDPADVLLRDSYPAGTADSAIVADLVANYLDLSGDGLDTSTLVENVGSPNPDMIGRVAFGGYTWEQAMNVIIRLTGAIYYIDPDKNLILTDVDTPNAPFILSDTPVPDDGVRYRDMELVYDGTELVNDVLVWGAGQGSDQMVFARVEDAGSIVEHGRWQMGDFRQDIFQQASVEHRATSIVHGSDQNQRGHKQDATSVMVTVHTAGFRAAQKVDFLSHVWGFQMVIPIRRVELTFLTKVDPRWRLTLSHFIDQPWNTFEWWIPPLPPFPPIEDGIQIGFPPFVPYIVIDSFDNRTTTFFDGVGFASGYPSFGWTVNSSGRTFNGYGWSYKGGNDDPEFGISLLDYKVEDFGYPWVGLWKFAAYGAAADETIALNVTGAAFPSPIPCFVVVDGFLSVADYYVMVYITDEPPDIRVRARIWLVWEDMPVTWDVDDLFTAPQSISLDLGGLWVDNNPSDGPIRVDYVWQLPNTNFPTTIAPTTYGWVTINVIPDPDRRTLRLGMVFLVRTPRVHVDGNLQAPNHYVEFPNAGRIVFNDDILASSVVEVTFFALRSV